METPIPVDSLSKAEAVEAARKFISRGDLMHIQDAWSARGTADFSLHRQEFRLIAKVLYVGIGELSK